MLRFYQLHDGGILVMSPSGILGILQPAHNGESAQILLSSAHVSVVGLEEMLLVKVSDVETLELLTGMTFE